jgi:hypothetical protein
MFRLPRARRPGSELSTNKKSLGSFLFARDPGSTTFSLSPLIRETGSNHVFHGDAHTLVNRDLGIRKPARLPTKSHCSKSRSRRGVQAREFATTNRSRLKSVQCLNKQAALACYSTITRYRGTPTVSVYFANG